MQAVILVGGEGTRLRPLTSTVPKPVVQLVDRPFMAYMLEWLARHDVRDVLMACGFLPDPLRAELGDGSRYGVRLTFVVEPEPMGTGGALRYVHEQLPGGLDERFLMLNGDSLTDIDLSAQLEQHERSGARATLGLFPVEDPSSFGLVRLNDDGSVAGFLEKPEPHEIDTDLISAGVYVLEHSVLELIDGGRKVSIEHEVWPVLVGEGLYGVAHREAYWLDIGTPERYLQGTADILSGTVRSAVTERLDEHGIARGEGCEITGELLGPSVIGARCVIDSGAIVGPGAVLGDDVLIEAGARVERSVLLDGVHLGAGAEVRDAILAPGARLGGGAKASANTIVGTGVEVPAGTVLEPAVKLFPGVAQADGDAAA